MSDVPKPVQPDLEAISRNAAALAEGFGRMSASYLAPLEGKANGRGNANPSDEMGDITRTLGKVAETWMSDPQRAMAAQAQLSEAFMALWGSTWSRMQGEAPAPAIATDPKDKRFADPEWTTNPVFDFIKQSYLITARWAEGLVENAEGIDARTRHKAEFYLRQILAAYSPSNFVMTNPELLRHTLAENGENLVRGLKMLAEDIEAGGGELRVRQTDVTAFTFGVDVAVTPGEVVYRNDLMELLQYAPKTETVLKRPFLIVPPWINKFYILDLNPTKSLIGWMVSQGLTVFVISWVNPDERHRDKDFESYMREGIETAIDQIGIATG
ncbi:PHA/PHB synthase family protein, partial [Methylobacterium thuringiense]